MSSRSQAAFDTNPQDGMYANLEERLRAAAAAMVYPATPDLASRERDRLARRGAAGIRRRRMAYGLAIGLIILLVGLIVSPARARVLDWIRIGAVRIFFITPEPAAPTLPAVTPEETGTPLPTATPAVTPTLLQSILDLAGETTLAAAREQAGFTIRLPAYPDDLDEPDFVFLQQFKHPVVILVWMDRQSPGEVRLSLSQTSSQEAIFEKYDSKSVVDTEVNGNPAVWVEGDYIVVMRSGEVAMSRTIRRGHTLVWSDGPMTYRLETETDLETAVRIAESLR